jgi:hypothetical protein
MFCGLILLSAFIRPEILYHIQTEKEVGGGVK